jgi:uncharacterized protein YndB with AHSA1/START domain
VDRQTGDCDSARVPTATVDAGTVRVAIQVDRSIDAAWLALTDPVQVSKWFGELDQPWLVGRACRIDFGDGDFFVATAIEIVEGKYVEFEWSFLGVGPLQRIRWSVKARPLYSSELIVEDHDPARTPAETDQMVTGWTDFFGRLQQYLSTGRTSRYEWREDIDGGVDLPAGGFDPLATETIYRWLPIATDGFAPRWFFVVDDEGPRRFRVDGWTYNSPAEVAFTVEIPEASVPTLCTVVVEPTAGGAGGAGCRLRFSHTGWRALGLTEHRSRVLRSRFAAAWIAALEQARGLAADASGSR